MGNEEMRKGKWRNEKSGMRKWVNEENYDNGGFVAWDAAHTALSLSTLSIDPFI